jgi:hypothetical protein
MSSAETSFRLRSRRSRLLTGGIGLATAAALFASGPVASAAPTHDTRATSSSTVEVAIVEPAGSQAGATFSSGISNITAQAGAGNNLQLFEATSNGFAMLATHNGENDGSDLILAQTTAGTPITGTANVPSGASLSARVNGGPSVPVNNGPFSIPVGAGLGARRHDVPASIRVSARSIRAGGKVTISGVAPTGTKRGARLTLMSDAFPAAHKVTGIHAITTRVRANGTYSTTVRVPGATKANTYAITGRVAGHYLPVVRLRVQG